MSKKFKIFDSDALKNIHKRVFFSIIIFSIVYFIIFFRIADIMIFKKSLQFSKNTEQIIERGKIFDRNELFLLVQLKHILWLLIQNKFKIVIASILSLRN